MAIVEVNFFSNTLGRNVTYKAIIPIDERLFNQPSQPVKPLKTIVLLHGIMGNCNDWLMNTRIAILAQTHNVAVLMPSGDNSFYVDQITSGNNYGEFVGRELLEEARRMFPLSHRRNDTAIVGLSMGGYGALRNGLTYHHLYGAIAGLSSALIIDQAIQSTNDPTTWVFGQRSYYESVFGDFAMLKGSDKDIEALVVNLKKNQGLIPKLYLTCGQEDFLIENNRHFQQFLETQDVEHTYVERPGQHDWKFWDETIKDVFMWLEGSNEK